MRKKPLNKDYVFGLLSYDSSSGHLTWLVSRGTVKPGKRAGSPQTSRGKTYIQIKIDKSFYKAHHLAWLFSTGEWPSSDLDHIDGDGTNNAISNLRQCTMTQNKGNSKIYKNNKSGLKGVTFRKKSGRWHAAIQYNNKRKWLGSFENLDAAAAAYLVAAKQAFGEYARPE